MTLGNRLYTILVHRGAMKVAENAVRQSVSLPNRLGDELGRMVFGG
jgi:hypothetical protein